jgi:hypothetical protein
MIERFIPQTRNLIAVAAREARTLGARSVGDEHFILAIVVEMPLLLMLPAHPAPWLEAEVPSVNEARALLRRDTRDALAALGISLDEIESRVEATFGADAWAEAAATSRIRFSHEGKRALELALRRAQRSRRRQVVVSDVLSGALEIEGRGRRLLVQMGVDVEELEHRLAMTQLVV